MQDLNKLISFKVSFNNKIRYANVQDGKQPGGGHDEHLQCEWEWQPQQAGVCLLLEGVDKEGKLEIRNRGRKLTNLCFR